MQRALGAVAKVGRLAFTRRGAPLVDGYRAPDEEAFRRYIAKALKHEREPVAASRVPLLLYTITDQTSETELGDREVMTPSIQTLGALRRRAPDRFEYGDIIDLTVRRRHASPRGSAGRRAREAAGGAVHDGPRPRGREGAARGSPGRARLPRSRAARRGDDREQALSPGRRLVQRLLLRRGHPVRERLSALAPRGGSPRLRGQLAERAFVARLAQKMPRWRTRRDRWRCSATSTRPSSRACSASRSTAEGPSGRTSTSPPSCRSWAAPTRACRVCGWTRQGSRAAGPGAWAAPSTRSSRAYRGSTSS